MPTQPEKLSTVPELIEIDVPYLNPLIDLNDLDENGNLLTKAEWDAAEKIIREEKQSNTVFERKYLETTYGDTGNFKHRLGVFADKGVGIYKGLSYPTGRFGKALGKGASGKVILAQSRDGQWHALKVQETKHQDEFVASQAFGLVMGNIATKTRLNPPSNSAHQKYYTLLQLAPGTQLNTLLEKSFDGKITLSSARLTQIAMQMLLAVKNIHANGYLHRDIKLENFVCHLTGNTTQLVDLGVAKKMLTVIDPKLEGTPYCLAPELKQLLAPSFTYNESTEIFALGIALKGLFGYEITFEWLRTQQKAFNKDTELMQDKELTAFLTLMTHSDPKKRPSLNEVIAFFKKFEMKVNSECKENIGVLNLEDYEKADAATRKEMLIVLRHFDEVALIDTNTHVAHFDKRRIAMIQQLESSGVVLSPKMLLGDDLKSLLKETHVNHPRSIGNFVIVDSTTTTAQLMSLDIPMLRHQTPHDVMDSDESFGQIFSANNSVAQIPYSSLSKVRFFGGSIAATTASPSSRQSPLSRKSPAAEREAEASPQGKTPTSRG